MTRAPLDPLARWLAVAWLVAWFAVVGVTAVTGPRWLVLYMERGVELPEITRAMLSLTDAITSGPGLIPVAVLLALGLAPLELASPPPATTRRWLTVGILHATVTGIGAWCAFVLPTLHITKSLDDVTTPDERKLQAMGFFLLVWVGVTLGQAFAWAEMMVSALRLPRESLRRELARSAMISALPAAALAWAVAAAVAELRLKAPEGTLAPPGLAAGGTAALLVVVGVLTWRLRARREVSADRP